MGYEFISVFPGHYESKNCKSIRLISNTKLLWVVKGSISVKEILTKELKPKTFLEFNISTNFKISHS